MEYTFSSGVEAKLTVGPGELGAKAGIVVNYKPAVAGPTLFEQIALNDRFRLLFTPTAAAGGQGFFASGGRIVVTGFVKDTGLGTSRLLADNTHWATGEGDRVTDFDRALGGGLIRTPVFEEITSVPEPSTMVLLVTGLLGLLAARGCRTRERVDE